MIKNQRLNQSHIGTNRYFDPSLSLAKRQKPITFKVHSHSLRPIDVSRLVTDQYGYTIGELKLYLEYYHLKKTGNKTDMIERLKHFINSQL